MAVLFDQFSYRINKTSEGIYYDCWHGDMFPEISIPEISTDKLTKLALEYIDVIIDQ